MIHEQIPGKRKNDHHLPKNLWKTPWFRTQHSLPLKLQLARGFPGERKAR
jgi:hypothetical protein